MFAGKMRFWRRTSPVSCGAALRPARPVSSYNVAFDRIRKGITVELLKREIVAHGRYEETANR
jgi:hypothetical protein